MRKFLLAVFGTICGIFLLPFLLVRSEPASAVARASAVTEPSTPTAPPTAAPAMATLSPTAQPSPEPTPEPIPEPSVEPTDPPAGAIELSATIRLAGVGEMPLEEYVAGVVAAEMAPSFPTEARRAQAVAARSLALYRAGHPKHGDCALCTDPGCCMAWTQPDAGAADAARDTRGVVATFAGEPIMAAFFSRSGGATASAADVWGGDVPYLVGVDSPWEVGQRASGHGVGMSQKGAAAMADEGADYAAILRHYYTGVEIG